MNRFLSSMVTSSRGLRSFTAAGRPFWTSLAWKMTDVSPLKNISPSSYPASSSPSRAATASYASCSLSLVPSASSSGRAAGSGAGKTTLN